MQIGEVARRSGVSAKMIRHYEEIGLIPPADRSGANYRDYDHADLHRMRFVRRARDLGFSMDAIRNLLRLWSDRDRASRDVKALTQTHLAELDRRIAQMQDMRLTLAHLADACDGDSRPHCPIIESLAGETAR